MEHDVQAELRAAAELLRCPTCGEPADQFSQVTTWAEGFDVTGVRDGDATGVDFVVDWSSERWSNALGTVEERARLHCPNGHEWPVPKNAYPCD